MDGKETQLADDYAFRKQVSNLSHWSVIADNWQTPPENQGSHSVSNMDIKNVKQNVRPVFGDLNDVVIKEGSMQEITIRAKDPLGGIAVITAENLPRFAELEDKGNGSAILTLKPYSNCGGCDLGSYDIKLLATNSDGPTEEIMNVTVTPLVEETIDIVVDPADATIFESGDVQVNPSHTSIDIGSADYGTPTQMNAVMPFELPVIPNGKKVKAAYLRVVTEFNNPWVDVNFDVYALDARATSEVLYSDFYKGSYDADANATAIQEALFKKDSSLGEYKLNDASAVTLADFIMQQYANGASAGQFVFLRVNANRDLPTWAQAKISAYETADETNRAKLVLVLEDI
jgi:hypothetical protein